MWDCTERGVMVGTVGMACGCAKRFHGVKEWRIVKSARGMGM